MGTQNAGRVKELEAIAWTLVTPEVQAKLDEMNEDPMRDLERARRLRELARAHQDQGGCTQETSRRHIAKALRRRRGELVATRGGRRPLAGRPTKKDAE